MRGDELSGSKLGITAVVMAAALMAVMDITIVNVALNDIRASFGTPIDQIGWVSTGYMMANIVIIPMTGWFQRRFGYRRYFSLSVFLFTLASALCGLAWDLPSLVVFRALQGLGGGAIVPTAQSILFARYPKSEHGMAAAFFGLGSIGGPLLGPALGGYLIEWSSWHWIFMVNVPVGVAVALLALHFIEQPGFVPPRGPAARVDAFGIALLGLGMPSLQYVLEEGNREGFDSGLISVLTIVAGATLITFVIHELETARPIVDLRVFKRRNYAAGTGLNFLIGFALFGGSFLFSLYAGSVLHYSALEMGKVFLAAGTVSLVMMPITGRIGSRIDERILLAAGAAIMAYSQWMASHLTAAAGFWDAVGPNWLRGIGLALMFVPLSTLALSQLSAEQRGNAAGLFNLTRVLGGSFGTALMGMLLSDGAVIRGSRLAESVTPYNPLVQEQLAFVAASVGTQTYQPQLVGESLLAARVHTQALVLTFSEGFRWVAVSMASGLLMVLLLSRSKPGVTVVAGEH